MDTKAKCFTHCSSQMFKDISHLLEGKILLCTSCRLYLYFYFCTYSRVSTVCNGVTNNTIDGSILFLSVNQPALYRSLGLSRRNGMQLYVVGDKSKCLLMSLIKFGPHSLISWHWNAFLCRLMSFCKIMCMNILQNCVCFEQCPLPEL